MGDERAYMGQPQMEAMPHGGGRPLMGQVAVGGSLSNKSNGLGSALDELCVEAEQLLQTAAQMMDILTPVLRPPQPAPEMARAKDASMGKSGYHERIHEEILKIRHAKYIIIDAMQRLDF